MRPKSVKTFELLYLISLIIGLVGTIISWNATLAQFRAGAGSVSLSPSILVGILLFAYVLSLLLWYLTARRASNVAKWLLVVFTLLGLIGLPALAVPPFTLIKIIGILSSVLAVVAVSYLFRADARAWFAGDEDDEDEMPGDIAA